MSSSAPSGSLCASRLRVALRSPQTSRSPQASRLTSISARYVTWFAFLSKGAASRGFTHDTSCVAPQARLICLGRVLCAAVRA